MSRKFKQGDRVRRIEGSFRSTKLGGEYVVDNQRFGETSLFLVGCDGAYDADMFELVVEGIGIDLNKEGWHIPISNQAELEAAYVWLSAKGFTGRRMSCPWPSYATYLTNVSVEGGGRTAIKPHCMHGSGEGTGRKIELTFQTATTIESFTVEVAETPAQKKLRVLEDTAALIQKQITELKAQI